MLNRLHVTMLILCTVAAIGGCTSKDGASDSVPTGGAAEAPVPFDDTQWFIAKVNQTVVMIPPDTKPPFVQFNTGTQSTRGFAGCNGFRGNCEIKDSALKFGEMITTKMACPDTDKLEADIHQAFTKTASYVIKGKELRLLDESGAVLVIAVAKQ